MIETDTCCRDTATTDQTNLLVVMNIQYLQRMSPRLIGVRVCCEVVQSAAVQIECACPTTLEPAWQQESAMMEVTQQLLEREEDEECRKCYWEKIMFKPGDPVGIYSSWSPDNYVFFSPCSSPSLLLCFQYLSLSPFLVLFSCCCCCCCSSSSSTCPVLQTWK